MADDNDGSQPRGLPEIRAAPVTPDTRNRGSYETGESSATGSLRGATPARDRGFAASAGDALHLDSSPRNQQRSSAEHAARDGRFRRRDKHRSGGAFLLHDAVSGDREQAARRRSASMRQHKRKASPQTPERMHPSPAQHLASKSTSVQAPGTSTASPTAHPGSANQRPSPEADADTSSANQSPSGLDLDSTQIVNMALNLSESRRSGSHRYASRPNPPRLAPLPDSASRSNLRQHFQQQRKTSHTGSPRPNQISSPRIPSGLKASSSLQHDYESSQDGPFHYHFSASTLARAQKAKEHLELMGEYRRLLEHLPPLKPGHDSQHLTSPPGSPSLGPKTTKSSTQENQSRGRPYNPLQYIRNRKVRARERKVIDGEQQGFGDVECVREWVNRISQRDSVASTNSATNGAFTMPHFPGVDESDHRPSPESAPKHVMRARRPRVDWFFDPCDMIADAYWLEQDSHKQLIEDRLWRKVFPQISDTSRPISRHAEEPGLGAKIAERGDGISDMQDAGHVDTGDGTQGTTRLRAKQKLHDMKGFHHRRSSSLHSHHDFPRVRRESLSEASGSESELKADTRRRSRHGRRETITSDANDLLQKQMLDMVAQEAREKELENVPETETEHIKLSDPTSPERVPSGQTASRSHSRKTSVADFNDAETRSRPFRTELESPIQYQRGRESLEVPDDRRHGSVADVYQSIPNSPKLGEGQEHIGWMDVSMPSSRSGSPTRNPLSKVRRKLRDKNRDAGGESQSEDVDDDTKQEPQSPERITTRPTDENHKAHRSTGSIRLRGDDQSGLRGLFRGPRIDTVLRGSVSKLGDILWKKDDDDLSPSEDESTEESDGDAARVGDRQSLSLSRRESRRLRNDKSRQLYDSLPQFHHVGEMQSRSFGTPDRNLGVPDISRPQSRQSARWEQLKPPRIDVRSASPTLSPQISHPEPAGAADVSNPVSHKYSVPEEPISEPKSRSQSRHWSITDRTPSPGRPDLSKREVARMRALILSSGIKAMEITRRAHQVQKPLCKTTLELANKDGGKNTSDKLWADIAQLAPNDGAFHDQQVATCDVYPLASRALGMAIQASGQRWQSAADHFTSKTTPDLQQHIWGLRSRIADELSQMTRRAADEADETSKELALDQPLKVKHVVDVIEKLLRKRRRRFRWVRRAMWLAVEWVLVGFMWYVWFVVMILRVFWGVGRGFWNGVRWLLWL